MKNLPALFVCIFLVKVVHAQQLNLKPGSEFTVETHHTYILDVGRGPVKKEQSFIFQFKMLNQTVDGYRLSCTMYKAKLWDNFSSDGDINKFNSDSVREADTHKSGVVMPLIFLQKSFDVSLKPNGKFLRVVGVDDLIQQATAKWNLTESVQQYITNHWAEFIIPVIQNIFFELPAQKIGYQTVWTNNETNTSYKVTAIAGPLLTITASSTDTLKAKYTLNDVNGLLDDSWLSIDKQQEEGKVKIHHDYSHKIIYDKQFATVDTAWANMAIMLSSWNKKIKPDGYHIDSAIVFKYFKVYDAIYKDDAHYNIEKVSLVNQLGNFSNGVYKKLVLQTPNKFLGETELQNKMNYIMDTDIDQIYDFVKYRYKTLAFNSWLQGSLSMHLLSELSGDRRINDLISQGYSKAKALEIATQQDRNFANSNLLLERMHNDKDPAIRQKVEAMYLWINAYHHSKEPTYLAKTAQQFDKLSDASLKAGNGTSYGLAIYSIMDEAGMKEEAEAVLNKTLSTTERFMADGTFDKDNYLAERLKQSAREVLMVGYYVKYQKEKLTDSTKALTYLAKAALNSPPNFNARSNQISSDRMMFLSGGLHSEPSYRKEYIEKLFSMGNKEEGMKLFAANITADLGSLNEMQKIYQEHFPDKKFSDFVKNIIIANWDNAPAFSAKDIKGKAYSLADYKGQWLIIDFWGTWCGPCRAEMPQVEAFNKEILQGRYPSLVMLGVATNDSEKTLKQYYKETNATLTSVLENEDFYKYKINAVPTKCLVAPNGKMVKLPTGTDWKEVIIKLNDLYAAN